MSRQPSVSLAACCYIPRLPVKGEAEKMI